MVISYSLIDIPCEKTGRTALHVAVAQEKLKVVQVLLDLGARLDIKDAEGNTVYHLAAKFNKEMVQVSLVIITTIYPQQNRFLC